MGPAVLFLAAAVAASGALLIVLSAPITFYLDDWDFLLHRSGFGAGVLLEPHNDHIALIPILIYKALLGAFGMDSPRPFQFVSILIFLSAVVTLFSWLRRRVGDWLALAAVIPILFFGASWFDLIAPFQLAFFGSFVCGIGALLALEQDTRRGDAWACGLLVASTGFQSLGLPFMVAAAVRVGWRGEPGRRLYVPAVPFGLYVIWWLGWGRHGASGLSFDNVSTLPTYLFDGLASSLSSLIGLATQRHDDTAVGALDWGRPLLIAVVGIVSVVVYRRGASRWFWAVVAMTISFWALGALNAHLFREPSSSRYQVIGAIFLLMVAAELFRGVRAGPGLVAVVFALSLASTASNLVALRDGARSLEPSTSLTRADLGALEIARGLVDPSLVLEQDNAGNSYGGLIDVGSYFAAVDDYGSPAYSPAELALAPEPARAAADVLLGTAEKPSLSRPPAQDSLGSASPDGSARPAPRPVGSCEAVHTSNGAPAQVTLPAGGALLLGGPGTAATLSLRRYAAESFPVGLGEIGPGARELRIAADADPRPWQMLIDGPGRISVCALSAP